MSEQLVSECAPAERSMWRPVARVLYWVLFISAVPLAMYLAFGDRHAPAPRAEHTLPPMAAKAARTASAGGPTRADAVKSATARN